MLVVLTEAEAKLAAQMLRLASDEFGNHGCNDLELPDTPENRVLVEELERQALGKDFEKVGTYKGNLLTWDTLVMNSLAKKLDGPLARKMPDPIPSTQG